MLAAGGQTFPLRRKRINFEPVSVLSREPTEGAARGSTPRVVRAHSGESASLDETAIAAFGVAALFIGVQRGWVVGAIAAIVYRG